MAVVIDIIPHTWFIVLLPLLFSNRKKEEYVGYKDQKANDSNDVLNHSEVTIYQAFCLNQPIM